MQIALIALQLRIFALLPTIQITSHFIEIQKVCHLLTLVQLADANSMLTRSYSSLALSFISVLFGESKYP